MPQLVNAYDNLIDEAHAQEAQGWGDADKCTYHEGYVSQPVYACATCSNKSDKVFGFCFGCSMSCHLDHEVYELFEKRNFRCDCATPKSVHLCTLNPKTQTVNTLNQYNHNFKGLYCWCSTPYDHNSNVTMIQCYMCQDWFHDTCILKDYPYQIPEEQDTDFICKDCIHKYQGFLGKYKQLEHIEVEDNNSKDESIVKTENEQKDNNIRENDNCLIASKEIGHIRNYFFKGGWREKLCRCPRCLKMYDLVSVNYLINNDEEKENPNNEESGTVNSKSSVIDEHVQVLTQQREIAYGIQAFRDNLMEFLKPFAAQKRTVTAADIEKFKEDFQLKKRKKH
jgi:E3 ubiquitin-protein ligase UBR7